MSHGTSETCVAQFIHIWHTISSSMCGSIMSHGTYRKWVTAHTEKKSQLIIRSLSHASHVSDATYVAYAPWLTKIKVNISAVTHYPYDLLSIVTDNEEPPSVVPENEFMDHELWVIIIRVMGHGACGKRVMVCVDSESWHIWNKWRDSSYGYWVTVCNSTTCDTARRRLYWILSAYG